MKRIGIVLLISIIVLSGCGVSAIELTEQEQTTVANYAAKTLLKYDKSYKDGIVKVNTPQVDEEEASKPSTTVPVKEETEIPEEVVGDEVGKEELGKEELGKEVSDNIEESQKVSVPLNEAMGLLDYTLDYTGYEIADSYLEANYFALNATPGKTFLILKFRITNVSSQESCDILAKKIRFKAILDGNQSIPAQSTILLNDLSTYQASLAIGESAETVLLFEMPVENSTFAGTIDLDVKKDETTSNVSLQ